MPRSFLFVIILIAAAARAQDNAPPPVTTDQDAATKDAISAVQKRPLREAKRLELTTYGEMSIGDPYLQRWGGGLRAMYHLREGLSLGLDANVFGTYRLQELVVARSDLHANVIESHERGSLAAVAAIAPLYGKVALPGDILVHFETFLDLGMGGAWTETDSTKGVRPLLEGGIGQRIFLNQSFALMGRLGGNLYAERVVVNGDTQTKAMGFWSFSFGLSYYFGGSQ
jgi:outer membrane beta-barrel protein